jgi:hypothetical protein
MLNWPLLKNPLNWVIVWAVLLIGALLAHTIGQHIKAQSAPQS